MSRDRSPDFTAMISKEFGIELPDGVYLRPSHDPCLNKERVSGGISCIRKTWDGAEGNEMVVTFLSGQASPHFDILPPGNIQIRHHLLGGLFEIHEDSRALRRDLRRGGFNEGDFDQCHIVAPDLGAGGGQYHFLAHSVPMSIPHSEYPIGIYYPGGTLFEVMMEHGFENPSVLLKNVQDMFDDLSEWLNDLRCSVVIETWTLEEGEAIPTRASIEVHDQYRNRMEALTGLRDLTNAHKEPGILNVVFGKLY